MQPRSSRDKNQSGADSNRFQRRSSFSRLFRLLILEGNEERWFALKSRNRRFFSAPMVSGKLVNLLYLKLRSVRSVAPSNESGSDSMAFACNISFLRCFNLPIDSGIEVS